MKYFDRDEDGHVDPDLDVSKTTSSDDYLIHGKRKGFEPTELLNSLIQSLPPEDLRNLAGKLLKVADAIDQNWEPSNLRSEYSWPSAAHRIEKNAVELAKRAKVVLSFRGERSKFLPPELLGETTWEMLLELFCQFAGGAAISVKSLTIASGAPSTTALRQIEKLERAGFISRNPSQTDARVILIKLTKLGVVKVGLLLERIP